MTVAELILELQKMPQNLDVYTLGGKADVIIAYEYPLGDSANTKCEYVVLYGLNERREHGKTQMG